MSNAFKNKSDLRILSKKVVQFWLGLVLFKSRSYRIFDCFTLQPFLNACLSLVLRHLFSNNRFQLTFAAFLEFCSMYLPKRFQFFLLSIFIDLFQLIRFAKSICKQRLLKTIRLMKIQKRESVNFFLILIESSDELKRT